MFFRTAIFLLGLIFISFHATAQCSNSTQKSHHAKTISYEHKPDIVEIAISDDNFGTLVTALKTAELVSTLQGSGPFTVFAPTNAAFSKLPAGTVESLLKPENKNQLSKILTYHVIAGKFMAEDVIKAVNNSGGSFTIPTVSGGKLTARLNAGTLLLTDENSNVIAVTQTDVNAANGVIHVIDSVLLPK